MRGRTQGERKLSNPAVNEIATPRLTPSSMPSSDPGERADSGASAGGGSAGRRVRARLLRRYYDWKYRVFRRERRSTDGRRGVIVLQMDALAYAELRRAIELGYCPTISRMVREEGYTLRRWFCGLPSATPYCQAGRSEERRV